MDWQTREGGQKARQSDRTKGYLPKKVWNKLSKSEKKEAEQSKNRASKQGEQYLEWTPAIKRAMAEAGYSSDLPSAGEPTKRELYERARKLDIKGRSKMSKNELKKAIADHA